MPWFSFLVATTIIGDLSKILGCVISVYIHTALNDEMEESLQEALQIFLVFFLRSCYHLKKESQPGVCNAESQ
ncbi:uncharacterized protein BYT42DRAFT_556177 [Radiomyces spectabilis]|uniref:uncharacterized protein n=1 Tax=Radiomyces spectabilis TaxID=64574 RepID=UPI00221FEB29|nr:uncharacterized protein BYT42DRAFT_556177 [Radiomyces spectabilis]KAI8391251.1 hypothetical protein BYT42DRAFT_556177 [Radiomyces spectabilis]